MLENPFYKYLQIITFFNRKKHLFVFVLIDIFNRNSILWKPSFFNLTLFEILSGIWWQYALCRMFHCEARISSLAPAAKAVVPHLIVSPHHRLSRVFLTKYNIINMFWSHCGSVVRMCILNIIPISIKVYYRIFGADTSQHRPASNYGRQKQQDGKTRTVALFELESLSLSETKTFKQFWQIPPLVCRRWHSNPPRLWMNERVGVEL